MKLYLTKVDVEKLKSDLVSSELECNKLHNEANEFRTLATKYADEIATFANISRVCENCKWWIYRGNNDANDCDKLGIKTNEKFGCTFWEPK